MKTLSPKQQQIYDYIVSFSGLHGYPPSVRELSLIHISEPTRH